MPAFALTEPEAGSDASNQITVAKVDGDNFIINGEKTFIMHGDVADVIVQALSAHTRSRVLASPKILVNDNQTGTLESLFF